MPTLHGKLASHMPGLGIEEAKVIENDIRLHVRKAVSGGKMQRRCKGLLLTLCGRCKTFAISSAAAQPSGHLLTCWCKNGNVSHLG